MWLEETWQEKEVNSLSITSKVGWKYSTPRFAEVTDSPSCNNTDIGWYMRIPTNLPQGDPRVEMPFMLCEEEGTTLKTTFSRIENQLQYWDG